MSQENNNQNLDADELNQRYNQFKVSFDENILPLRQGYNRRLGKMLLKEFPGLYKYRMLILVSEIGSTIMLTEQELIYWYTVSRNYLAKLQKEEGELFLKVDVPLPNEKVKKTDLNENHKFVWTEERLEEILILCGMYIKKEFLMNQQKQYDKKVELVKELSATCDEKTKERMQKNLNLDNDSISEQKNEILCIEQNLKSFHSMVKYSEMYNCFTESYTFNIAGMSQSEFNKQFLLFRRPMNQQDQDKKQILGKRKNSTDLIGEFTGLINSSAKKDTQQVIQEEIDDQQVDYNWQVDLILKHAQQYNKEGKLSKE